MNSQASFRLLRASAQAAQKIAPLFAILAPGAAALLLLSASSAQAAQNDAWSTASNDNTFAGNNWSLGTTTPGTVTGTIASGDSTYFGPSSITTLNDNEVAGFTLEGITFNSDAPLYTISGNSIALIGNITNSSATLQTINDAMTVTNVGAFSTTTGNLTLGGNITETNTAVFSLATGGGTVTLGGTNNLYRES